MQKNCNELEKALNIVHRKLKECIYSKPKNNNLKYIISKSNINPINFKKIYLNTSIARERKMTSSDNNFNNFKIIDPEKKNFLRTYGLGKKFLPAFKAKNYKNKNNFKKELNSYREINKTISGLRNKMKSKEKCLTRKLLFFSFDKGLQTDKTLNKLIMNYKGRSKVEKNSNRVEQFSKDDNLCYYFPNLFYSFTNKKKISPQKNSIKDIFLFRDIKEIIRSKEKEKEQKLINHKGNESITGDIISKKNIIYNRNKNNNPIFLEKVFTFKDLKNVRFNFKNSIEKYRYKNIIDNFNTSKQLTKI